MEHTRNRTAVGKILNSPQTEAVLARHATPIAEAIRARTKVDSGDTAGSTRVEGGHRNARGDRVAVRIVQEGAALQLHYGHGNTPADRHMTSGY